MKKEMMELLKNYIKKYNGMLADLEIDTRLGCDVKYDKGKKYQLCYVIYDIAMLLGIKLNVDIKGIITIAE